MKKYLFGIAIALCALFTINCMYDYSENFDDNHIVVANTSDKSYIVRLRAGIDPIKVIMPEDASGIVAKGALVTEDSFKIKPKTIFYINKKNLVYPLRIRVWEDQFYPGYDADLNTKEITETSKYNQENTLTSKLIDEDAANKFNVIELVPKESVVLSPKIARAEDYAGFDVIK